MPTKRTVVALAVTLIVAGTLSTTPAQAQDWKSYAGHHYTFILRKTGKTYRAAVWDQSLDSLTRCFKGRVGKPPHYVISGKSWWWDPSSNGKKYSSLAWLKILDTGNRKMMAIWLRDTDGRARDKQPDGWAYGKVIPTKDWLGQQVGQGSLWREKCLWDRK